MRHDQRGRLTVPDIVFILFSLAMLGALSPVFYTVLERNADSLGPGAGYLFQLIVPLGILVLFSVIYAKATAGGG